MSRIDWPGLMRLGLGRLGLAPEAFWALTPAELMMMAGMGLDGPAAMTRGGLEALIRAYPDKEKDKSDGVS